MSMFYELMMRKKTQIMYATIKGTLTESPYGVFSGFSASNYLQLQQNFAPSFEDNFEIEIKLKYVNPDNLNTNERILTQTNGSGFIIYNKQFGISLTDINNNTVVNTAFSFSVITPQDNTIYFWKLKGGNGNYTFTVYDENHNKLAEITFTSTVALLPFNRFGSNAGTRYFNGSIDLNNSYIKLGSTKYKLQAVVGYTVVGSPTITDGVVSGFSANDYITTPALPSNITNMHLHTEFTISSASAIQGIFMVNGYPSIECQYKQFRIYVRNSDNTTSVYGYQGSSITTNNNVIVDFYFKDGISNFVVYQNGIKKLDVSYNDTIISSGIISYGKDWSPLANGELDIGKTIIEINNKLWFNGQQA